jgi:hypothetical protein
MPTTAIPLVDTLLFSDLPDPVDGYVSSGSALGNTHVDETYYPLLRDGDVFPMERPVLENDLVNEVDYLPENYQVTLGRLRKAILFGLQSVRAWQPNTVYSAGLVDPQGVVIRSPDFFTNDGSLYITTEDHESQSSFSQLDGNGMVIATRITTDNDPTYVEITANIRAPILSGDEIGAYVAQRQLLISKEYQFPNADLGHSNSNVEATAYCNPDITAPCSVTITRIRETASTVIGSILFTPDVGATHRIPGVFTFNDPEMGSWAATTLILNKGNMLVFEADTVALDLAWIRLNMVAQAISFTSANFDRPA